MKTPHFIVLFCTDQSPGVIPLSNKTHLVVTTKQNYTAIYLDSELVHESLFSSTLELEGLYSDPGGSGAWAMDPSFKVNLIEQAPISYISFLYMTLDTLHIFYRTL